MEMHSAGSLLEVHGIDGRPARGQRSGLIGRFRGFARAIAAELERARQIERDLDQLQRMDDRMLADIGIARSDIEVAVRHGRRR